MIRQILREKEFLLSSHLGEHEDYHKVSDEVSKINFSKIEKVAKLCYKVVHRLANSEVKPKLNQDKLVN